MARPVSRRYLAVAWIEIEEEFIPVTFEDGRYLAVAWIEILNNDLTWKMLSRRYLAVAWIEIPSVSTADCTVLSLPRGSVD